MEQKIDYTHYLDECHSRIHDTDYWKTRGLSEDIIEKYHIGYTDGQCESSTGEEMGVPSQKTANCKSSTQPLENGSLGKSFLYPHFMHLINMIPHLEKVDSPGFIPLPTLVVTSVSGSNDASVCNVLL